MCLQVICAGSLDTFQIFVWATKTARLLDVLAAHEGPVVALAFSPTQPLLASGSWDKTVRTWDVFRSVLKASNLLLEALSLLRPAALLCQCKVVCNSQRTLPSRIRSGQHTNPALCVRQR